MVNKYGQHFLGCIGLHLFLIINEDKDLDKKKGIYW